ncbi:MAG: DUF4783 domain-containing protein [Candidatus Latescibacterota bacterium]|nr:MAG: DUF4783 domain-containing protein [Candidatus Latescibacterota bacterium]
MNRRILSGLPLYLLCGWVCLAVAHPTVKSSSAQNKKKLDASQVKTVTDTEPQTITVEPDSVGPIGVFADIEVAWRKENVEKILRHYGKGKVGIAIEGSGPTGGTFSRNQSYYLLKDLFKYTITEKFEFVQYRNISEDEDKVYAVAEREYKRNDDGRLFKDKIYVSLHLESDRWVIDEIKSIR